MGAPGALARRTHNLRGGGEPCVGPAVMAVAVDSSGSVGCKRHSRPTPASCVILGWLGHPVGEHIPDRPLRPFWAGPSVGLLPRPRKSPAHLQDTSLVSRGAASHLSGVRNRILVNPSDDGGSPDVLYRDHRIHPVGHLLRRGRLDRQLRAVLSRLSPSSSHADSIFEAPRAAAGTG